MQVEGSSPRPEVQPGPLDKVTARVSAWFSAKVAPIKQSVDSLVDKIAAKIAERQGCHVEPEQVKRAIVGCARLLGKLLLASLAITVAAKCFPLVVALSTISSISVALYGIYHAIMAGKTASEAQDATFKQILAVSVSAFFEKGIKQEAIASADFMKKLVLETIDDIHQTQKLFKIIGGVLGDSLKKPEEIELLDF